MLLSLDTYQKTNSSKIVDELVKLGHEISYKETRFIEDKWAKWCCNKSITVPSNIHKGISGTRIGNNIDWKSKDLDSPEIHNRNSIFIQNYSYDQQFK